MQFLDRVVPYSDVCRLSFSSCPECGSKKLTMRDANLGNSEDDRMISNRCSSCGLWWAAVRGDYIFESDYKHLLDLLDPHKPAKEIWIISLGRLDHPGRLVAHRKETIFGNNKMEVGK